MDPPHFDGHSSPYVFHDINLKQEGFGVCFLRDGAVTQGRHEEIAFLN